MLCLAALKTLQDIEKFCPTLFLNTWSRQLTSFGKQEKTLQDKDKACFSLLHSNEAKTCKEFPCPFEWKQLPCLVSFCHTLLWFVFPFFALSLLAIKLYTLLYIVFPFVGLSWQNYYIVIPCCFALSCPCLYLSYL